jgi:hypothetical protein
MQNSRPTKCGVHALSPNCGALSIFREDTGQSKPLARRALQSAVASERLGKDDRMQITTDNSLPSPLALRAAMLANARTLLPAGRSNPSRPIRHAARNRSGPISARSNGFTNVLFGKKIATRENLNSVRFVLFHLEMFHEQPAVVGGHLLVVSLRDGIRRSLCATFEHLGFLAEDRKLGHRYLLVVAAEGSYDVSDLFQVGL